MKIKDSCLLALSLLLLLSFSACKKDFSLETLQGKTWIAQEMQHGEIGKLEAPASYAVLFTASDSVFLRLDINVCQATYQATASTGSLEVGTLGCTLACCDSRFAIHMLDLIHRSEGYFIKDGMLTLEVGEEWVCFKEE